MADAQYGETGPHRHSEHSYHQASGIAPETLSGPGPASSDPTGSAAPFVMGFPLDHISEGGHLGFRQGSGPGGSGSGGPPIALGLPLQQSAHGMHGAPSVHGMHGAHGTHGPYGTHGTQSAHGTHQSAGGSRGATGGFSAIPPAGSSGDGQFSTGIPFAPRPGAAGGGYNGRGGGAEGSEGPWSTARGFPTVSAARAALARQFGEADADANTGAGFGTNSGSAPGAGHFPLSHSHAGLTGAEGGFPPASAPGRRTSTGAAPRRQSRGTAPAGGGRGGGRGGERYPTVSVANPATAERFLQDLVAAAAAMAQSAAAAPAAFPPVGLPPEMPPPDGFLPYSMHGVGGVGAGDGRGGGGGHPPAPQLPLAPLAVSGLFAHAHAPESRHAAIGAPAGAAGAAAAGFRNVPAVASALALSPHTEAERFSPAGLPSEHRAAAAAVDGDRGGGGYGSFPPTAAPAAPARGAEQTGASGINPEDGTAEGHGRAGFSGLEAEAPVSVPQYGQMAIGSEGFVWEAPPEVPPQ